ncbi:hypothetical protein K501DRAFT_250376 [Backusella circina FSU 941]|nr:hypothetical protein K501DRAFT_250376 [Backusella circina FSU 941]
MFKLSSLPLEILYYIGGYVPTEDLITLGRLNLWYSYWVSSLIADRIANDVQKDGWRIHVDILSTSHPKDDSISSGFPFSIEMLLLSEFIRINPITLGLEFKLCPLEENGFDSKTSAVPSESSVVIFDKINTNINILAFFAQIPKNVEVRELEHINHAGASVVDANSLMKEMKEGGQSTKDGVINMGLEFNVEYGVSPITEEHDQSLEEKIEMFRNAYHRHKVTDTTTSCADDTSAMLKDPAMMIFKNILVSPDWWVQQMKTPSLEQNVFELVLW